MADALRLTSFGDYKSAEKYLKDLAKGDVFRRLDEYGRKGVEALAAATPKDTGKTADSWSYEITYGMNRIGITWKNSNENQGIPIILLIHYGHGMPNGGYVEGRDFINPTMKPIFDEIEERIWKEVTR